jgi:hypothetical protein
MGLLVWDWYPCLWGVEGRGVSVARWGPPFWGGVGWSAISFVSSFGWVTVTVLSALCARLSPRKLCNCVVFADACDHGLDVGVRVAEDEGVINVYDDVRCYGCGDLVEEAVVEL